VPDGEPPAASDSSAVSAAALPLDGSVEEVFCALAAIPSPSGRERAVGEAIRTWLARAGIDAAFDGAGAVNGSDAGNLIATVPGAPSAPRLLFVAHMDTVESGSASIAPTLGDDGVIRSGGDTILGADNKSAVAAVMRCCRAAAAISATERATVIAAFTCREEAGQMGAALLDLDALRVDCAFSVDGSQPIGTVITRALGQQVFTIEVHGRAAHAAADPAAGVNAIAVAGEIVASMPLGRRPGGGSASIAAVIGGAVIDRLAPASLRALGLAGSADDADDADEADDSDEADEADGETVARAALEATPTNSVPDLVLLRGELRGYSGAELAAARSELEAVAARVCRERGARYQWHGRERAVPPFPGASDSRAVALARAAAGDVPGVTFAATEAHATLEANYLAAGTDVVALASGGTGPHQFSESITVAELRQLEALLTRIVELASAR
jgi:tripeptide aminopeptidase